MPGVPEGVGTGVIAYEKVAFVHYEDPATTPQQIVFEGLDCVDQAEKWAHRCLRVVEHWRNHTELGVCPPDCPGLRAG
jgi:hypothetical protein